MLIIAGCIISQMPEVASGPGVGFIVTSLEAFSRGTIKPETVQIFFIRHALCLYFVERQVYRLLFVGYPDFDVRKYDWKYVNSTTSELCKYYL